MWTTGVPKQVTDRQPETVLRLKQRADGQYRKLHTHMYTEANWRLERVGEAGSRSVLIIGNTCEGQGEVQKVPRKIRNKNGK